MALIGQSSGQNPQGGLQVLPVSGMAFTSVTPLAANGVITSGWLDTSGFTAIQLNVYSDQVGQYVLEFSNDKVNNVTSPVTVAYDASFAGILARQGGLAPRASYTRITYTNGATAQTIFQFSISFLTTNVQPSVETLKDNVADSRLAEVVKNVQQAKDTTGVYDFIFRTGNSLNVYLTGVAANAGAATSANQVLMLAKPTTGAPVTLSLPAATSTTVLAANTNRKGATIQNIGTSIVYVQLGTTASATLFTVALYPSQRAYYEIPFAYQGIITAFSLTATTIQVNELT